MIHFHINYGNNEGRCSRCETVYGEGECLNVKGQWKIKEQRKQSKAAFIT